MNEPAVPDEATFTKMVQRYRRELHVHCYRMLGSLAESEDLVQETFLRAWRRRSTFEGRSTFRAWLYRIATNACLDFLERRPNSRLEPYPDRLHDEVHSTEDEPDTVAVARETIELVFLTAIQHLPAKQRAVLLLWDVFDWPAKDKVTNQLSSWAGTRSSPRGRRPCTARTRWSSGSCRPAPTGSR